MIAAFALMIVPAAGAAGVGRITELTAGLGPARPFDIAAGPGGTMWFTSGEFYPAVGRVSAGGHVTRFAPRTNGDFALHNPWGIARGADGNMWFTDAETEVDDPASSPSSAIGRITPAGHMTLYRDGLQGDLGALSDPSAIAAGPDGNMWFVDDGFAGDDGGPSGHAAIGRITPDGTITEFSDFPKAFDDPHPIDLVAGPRGMYFFGDPAHDIGVITPQGDISVVVRGSTRTFGGGYASGLVFDAAGNLWFDDDTLAAAAIARLTPAGVLTRFTVGFQPVGSSDLWGLAAGPDGNIWFTDNGLIDSAVGRITPQGQVTEFTTGLREGNHSTLGGLAAGGGDIWFADAGPPTGAIGRIGTHGPLPPSASAPKVAVWTCVPSADRTDCRSTLAPRPAKPPHGSLPAQIRTGNVVDATGTAHRTATTLVITLTRLRHRLPYDQGYRLVTGSGATATTTRLHLLHGGEPE